MLQKAGTGVENKHHDVTGFENESIFSTSNITVSPTLKNTAWEMKGEATY